jgi:adenosylhomocysteine nucleosidase
VKVLVTFALESEFASWLRQRDFARIANLDFPAFETSREELQIRVAITGMGPKRAQRVGREALCWQPDVCIAAGFAGGLKTAFRVGDVLVPLTIRDGETHRSFVCDRRIVGVAEESGASRIATLCTCAYAVSTVEDKRRMSRSAEAVDMESFFILNEAQESAIPAVAIRAVSDAADESLPMDFTQVLDERGRVRISRLASKIVRSPQRIPALIRLGSASRRGAKHLAQVLDKTIESLSAAPGLFSERKAVTATA